MKVCIKLQIFAKEKLACNLQFMHKQKYDSPYLHKIEHKPGGDTLSHYIDEEVREGHAPDVWVLQNILY